MITYENDWGEHISETAKNICQLAGDKNEEVTTTFNGITLTAKPGATEGEILQTFDSELARRKAEYDASPEGKEAKRQAEEFRQQAAQAEAEGILVFEIKDQSGWQEWKDANQSGYGACIIRYAARWAHEMETQMTAGAKLADIAQPTSYTANKEGITGFMYGAAVRVLAQVWKHGEELRRWHNRAYQIGDEGDKANEKEGAVLNPAMLCIGG